mmetsp:Transcript_22840/g.38186  ORF Transcript_22840/g.38186 Transcript_22840/m.38186 type:complete len:89 (+) Transcript_22840:268-534(+)
MRKSQVYVDRAQLKATNSATRMVPRLCKKTYRLETDGTNIETPENSPNTSMMKQAKEAYASTDNVSFSELYSLKVECLFASLAILSTS